MKRMIIIFICALIFILGIFIGIKIGVERERKRWTSPPYYNQGVQE